MKRGCLLILAAALLAAMPAVVFAQDVDQQGCKDSRLLSRLSGCVIKDCRASEFDAAELTINLSADPRTKHVEGKLESVTYACRAKTALQVHRDAE